MASRFVGTLMDSRTQAHMFHLTTKSYAEHKALQTYYEGIVPLLDAWAEAYMGKYGRIQFGKKTTKNPKEYFKYLLGRIRAMRSLSKDSYLRNIYDEIVTLVESTLYMLSLS